MLVEQSDSDTIIRIPHALKADKEVKAFMAYLQKIEPPKTQTVGEKFEMLFQQWHTETALLSSGTAIVSHTAYRAIIDLGEAVIPFILIKLVTNPQHLFFALYQITGENPVPYAHVGNLELMTADWLNWGQQKGYLS